MGFTGDHARRRGTGIAEHLVGKPAHKNLLGSGSPKVRILMFRLLGATSQQAREHSWAAVRSRTGDERSQSTAARHREPS
ncbi:acyl-CoA synthetase [Mycobacterium alsense]|uniref:Acyl-CoA synthetase n=1 Tax=Mycobacterium alsense TaxID=324058 RepID=A0ABX3RC70_9MYCO|nr:acyl-CoA synthetase [Mycobacterium alsense]